MKLSPLQTLLILMAAVREAPVEMLESCVSCTRLCQYFLLCNSPLAQHTSRIINAHREVVGTAGDRTGEWRAVITEAEKPFYLQAATSIKTKTDYLSHQITLQIIQR